jgi:hypothetical protein
MDNLTNKHRPKWMIEYSDGKSKCVCKNCSQRFGKKGALSLKQREQHGTYGTSRH